MLRWWRPSMPHTVSIYVTGCARSRQRCETTPSTRRRFRRHGKTWAPMRRGDIYELRANPRARGHGRVRGAAQPGVARTAPGHRPGAMSGTLRGTRQRGAATDDQPRAHFEVGYSARDPGACDDRGPALQQLHRPAVATGGRRPTRHHDRHLGRARCDPRNRGCRDGDHTACCHIGPVLQGPAGRR